MANPDSGVKFQEDTHTTTPTPAPYTAQGFNADEYKKRILNSQFNGGASKRDQRRFNKYIASDAGQKALLDAEQRHDESEQATVRAFNKAATLANKYKTEFNRIGQETVAYEQNYWNENKDALQKQGWSYTPDANSAWGGTLTKSAPVKKVVADAKPISGNGSGKKKIPVVKKDPTWEEKMTSLGYTAQKRDDGSVAFVGDGNTYYSNGRMSNGKVISDYDYTKLNPLSDFHKKYSGLGYNRISIKDSNDFAYKDPTTNYIYYASGRVNDGKYWGTVDGSGVKWDNTTTVSNTAYKAPTKVVGEGFWKSHQANHNPELIQVRNDLLSSNKNLRDYHHWNYTTGMLGDEEYPMVVTTGLGADNPHNDRSYYYNPQTQMYALIDEDWQGKPKGAASTNNKVLWYTWDDIKKGATFADHKNFFKQGGIMNKVKYFQQGGSMSAQQVLQQLAQGIQNQDPKAMQALQDLATKAANGDEQSMQFLTGVQSLAEKGDQAATIIMNAITQMASAQQTPSAKWGSKLKYIRSLKYAKGGVACPACQAGAAIPTPQDKAYKKPIKKVEEKACGGKAKKAKKRYFGGWL